MDFALEGVEAFPVGEVALCGETETSYEVSCLEGFPGITIKVPQIFALLECCTSDFTVEDGVFLDIEFLVDVLKVCP